MFYLFNNLTREVIAHNIPDLKQAHTTADWYRTNHLVNNKGEVQIRRMGEPMVRQEHQFLRLKPKRIIPVVRQRLKKH